jgi:hypothetical protein
MDSRQLRKLCINGLREGRTESYLPPRPVFRYMSWKPTSGLVSGDLGSGWGATVKWIFRQTADTK